MTDTESFDYEPDLSDDPMPDDPVVDDSKSHLGSPPGSWKGEPATEQDELDQLDPDPEN